MPLKGPLGEQITSIIESTTAPAKMNAPVLPGEITCVVSKIRVNGNKTRGSRARLRRASPGAHFPDR